MKICSKCKSELPFDMFNTYFHSTHDKTYFRTYCKDCESQAKKNYKDGIKSLMRNYRDFWGGTTDAYYHMPNEYVDENQRLSVFRVMKLMGWKFNIHQGIWYKEPFKLKDGSFPTIKSKPTKVKKKTVVVSKETIERIKQLYKEGLQIWEISDECKCHKSTVYKYLEKTLKTPRKPRTKKDENEEKS